jgi:hypothetical protein
VNNTQVVQWTDSVCVVSDLGTGFSSFDFFNSSSVAAFPAFALGATPQVISPDLSFNIAGGPLLNAQTRSNDVPWTAIDSNGMLYVADHTVFVVGAAKYLRVYKINLTTRVYIGLSLIRLPDDMSGNLYCYNCDVNGDVLIAYQRNLLGDGNRTFWVSKFDPTTSATMDVGIQMGTSPDGLVMGACPIATGEYLVAFDDGSSGYDLYRLDAGITTKTSIADIGADVYEKFGSLTFGNYAWAIIGTDVLAYDRTGTVTATVASDATGAEHLCTNSATIISDTLQTISGVGATVPYATVEKYGGEAYDTTIASMLSGVGIPAYNGGMSISDQVGAR